MSSLKNPTVVMLILAGALLAMTGSQKINIQKGMLDQMHISKDISADSLSDRDIKEFQNTLRAKGIYFGTSVSPADIMLQSPRPRNFLTTISRYFNYYTIPISFGVTERFGRGEFNFKFPDKIVEFAIADSARIKGHALVIGSPLPDWLSKGRFSNEELQAILKNHIQSVVGHFRDKYPGKIGAWNVVNEPTCNGGKVIDPEKCLGLGIEKNIWSDIRKPGSDDPTDYIQLAFQWAKEADPSAKLFLNENGIEIKGSPKIDRVYNLIKHLKEKNVPIDGLGIQAHVRSYDKAKYSSTDLVEIMNRFSDIGLEVQISEFDVVMASGLRKQGPDLPTIQIPIDKPSASDFAGQADLYGLFLNACLHANHCTGFTTWGAWDGESWTKSHWQGSFFPHLLDSTMKPKPAFKMLILESRSYKK